MAVQMNYLLDAGAFKVLPDGTFTVDEAKIADAVTALTGEIMTIQAEGNYAKAKELLDRLGVVRPRCSESSTAGRRAGRHRAQVHLSGRTVNEPCAEKKQNPVEPDLLAGIAVANG